MKHISYSLLLCTIFILAGLLDGTSSFASHGPDTTIDMAPIQTFTAGKRIYIKGHINDSQGVLEARCYFKTAGDNSFLYTLMPHLKDDKYQCVIPGFDENTEQLQYFVLVENGQGQVIRSPLLKASSSKRTHTQLDLNEESSELQIYNELPDSINKASTIADKHSVIQATDHDRLLGLRAGLYNTSSLQLSKILHARRGFFGGFKLSDNNSIIPVEGMAPDLAETYSPPATPDNPQLPVRPSSIPDISGNDWVGYFRYGGATSKTWLNATIYSNGSRVTIITSKSGIAHYFSGSINSRGDMLVYDSYDGEAWTTHYGPATSTTISLYDYAWPPVAGEPEPPLNKLKLTRPPHVPPGTPNDVTATDGTIFDAIIVSWTPQALTKYYEVYSCEDNLPTSCTLVADSTSERFTDTSQSAGIVYYRIKACNDYGCSDFSDYDTGYERNRGLPFLELLLGEN